MSTENQTPYGFYYLDRDYLDGMREADNEHVPLADYEDFDRAQKFYCGPVITKDKVDYYVPVSHQIKNMYIPGSAQNGVREYYGVTIYDKNGNASGCLDFRYLIPCVNNALITPCQPKGHAVTEWDFCERNQKIIMKNANNTFHNIQANNYPFLTETSVDNDKAIDFMWYVESELEDEYADDSERPNFAITENAKTRMERMKHKVEIANQLAAKIKRQDDDCTRSL